MRVLIVTPLYPPDLGRLATYTKELARELSQNSQVTIVTYGNIAEAVPGVRIISLPKTIPLGSRLWQFMRLIWQEAKYADVLYVSDGASVGLPSLIAARLRHLPIVRFVMSDEAWERAVQSKTQTLSEEEFALLPPSDRKDAWVRRLQRFVLKRATRVCVSTHARKTLLQKLYIFSSSQIEVTPYPPEPAEILPFSPEPHPFRLLVTSPLMRKNGVDQIIRSVAQLTTTYPTLELVIASHGPELIPLKNLAQELGVSSRIHFLGYVSRVETWYYMRSSAALLLNHGSFHRPDEIYHAYAASLPIIASDIPAHQELIQNGTSGILVAQEEPEDVTRAIKVILEDTSLREKLIAGGKQALKHQASWQSHIEQLTHLFQEIISHS